jgi:hypothetical protein
MEVRVFSLIGVRTKSKAEMPTRNTSGNWGAYSVSILASVRSLKCSRVIGRAYFERFRDPRPWLPRLSQPLDLSQEWGCC